MSTSIPGGWTPFTSTLTAEDLKVFEQAMDDLIGVDYTPIAVSTQVVAGARYKFFCNGMPVSPDAVGFPAMVYIAVELEGEPKLVDIQKCPEFTKR